MKLPSDRLELTPKQLEKAWKNLPHFDLAELKAIPKTLVDISTPFVGSGTPDQQVDAFMLALAVAYNDLKGALWMIKVLFDAQPKDKNEISALNGQRVGMDRQFYRLTLSYIHEVLELVKRENALIRSDQFREILSRTPNRCQKDWEEIVSFSLEADETRTHKHAPPKSMKAALETVRSSGTFHYYNIKNFWYGYKHHFEKDSPHSAYAWASLGKNAEETRFYYADAAMDGIVNSRTGIDSKKFTETVDQLVKSVGYVIRYLLEHYIEVRLAAQSEAHM